MKNKSPILLHIPHSSIRIPQKYKGIFYLQKEALEKELLHMTDRYTDELFATNREEAIIFPISRILCDVERFRCDKDESMSKIGMGVCYKKTSDQKPLKLVTKGHKDEILKNFYDVHHKELCQATTKKIQLYGKAVIIDCHSFASVPLPYEPFQKKNRPDICIGADTFHTPAFLIAYAEQYFHQKGFSVGINDPYCGSIVPMHFYKQDKNVISVMIEVNRKQYMNEYNGEKTKDFFKMQETLHRFIEEIKEKLFE